MTGQKWVGSSARGGAPGILPRLVEALSAADGSWNEEFGDEPLAPQYFEHLAQAVAEWFQPQPVVEADVRQAIGAAVTDAAMGVVSPLLERLCGSVEVVVAERDDLAADAMQLDVEMAQLRRDLEQAVAIREQATAELEAVRSRAQLAEDERDKANRQNESLARRLHLRFQNEQKLSAALAAVKAKRMWRTAPISGVMHLVPDGDGRRESVCGLVGSTTWQPAVDGNARCLECARWRPDTEATDQAPWKP